MPHVIAHARPVLLVAVAAALGNTSAALAGDFCFATTPYRVQESPSCVMHGDFNGDGSLDLIAANHDFLEDTVSVLMNNGDGTFAPAVHYPVAGRPYWLAVADVDGDLDADAVVSNFYGHDVAVFINDGAGVFAPPVHYPTGFFPTFVILAHVNGDGALDLAAANAGNGTVSVLLNNGDGTFAQHVEYGVGVNPYGVTAADFNGDAALDLAVANYDADTPGVSILANNGDGTFAPQVMYPVSGAPVGNAAADLNADGLPDLAATIYGAAAELNSIEVMLNDGAGGFLAPVSYTVGTGPYSLVLHDINDDGHADIVSANTGPGVTSGDVSVLLNNGSGAFGPTQSYAAGGAPGSVAVGDLDGNTTPELAVAAYGDFNIFVLFNQFPAITQDPISQTVAENAAATFTVAVAGPGPFSYQWRRDGIDLADGPTIVGSTADSLTIDPATAADAGLYDVVITNDCGTLASAAAELIVDQPDTCPADVAPTPDGDGVVNVDDLLAVINNWGAGEGSAADITGDGTVNVDDLLAVINNWGACP